MRKGRITRSKTAAGMLGALLILAGTVLTDRASAASPLECHTTIAPVTVTVPPGQGVIVSYEIQPDCTVKQIPPTPLFGSGARPGHRVSSRATTDSFSTLTGTGLMYQWLRDVNGYQVNEPQMNISWQYNGTTIYTAGLLWMADYARVGWVVTANAAAFTSFTTTRADTHHHAEFIYPGGIHTSYDSDASVYPDGTMTCNFGTPGIVGVPLSTWSGMCFSSSQGIFKVGGNDTVP